MLYLTLNTGDVIPALRDEASEDEVELLRPIATSGGPIPGRPGYCVDIDRVVGGAAVFTISPGHAALATCGLAWTKAGARKLWPELLDAYQGVYGVVPNADPPKLTPWLSAIIMPPVLFGHSSEAWLGHFERCFAWAILDERLFI